MAYTDRNFCRAIQFESQRHRTMRERIQRRTRLRCRISIAVLSLAIFPATNYSQTTGRSETPRQPVPIQSSASSDTTSSSISPKLFGARSAPVASPLPSLRFLAVFCAALVINAARLANKFRRFLGLGVFTNFFAVLFLVFGAGVSGLPALSEGLLSSNLHIEGKAAAWLAGLSGILVALILPGIRLKPNSRSEGESQIRGFEGTLSPNPILAFLENGIRDQIAQRIQLELSEASRRFDMGTIKLAAGRALAEEMTMWPLGHEDYEAARQSIEQFRARSDRYRALLELLRWCSFKRLIRGLNDVASEAER